jgi:hypothetical protein
MILCCVRISAIFKDVDVFFFCVVILVLKTEVFSAFDLRNCVVDLLVTRIRPTIKLN